MFADHVQLKVTWAREQDAEQVNIKEGLALSSVQEADPFYALKAANVPQVFRQSLTISASFAMASGSPSPLTAQQPCTCHL